MKTSGKLSIRVLIGDRHATLICFARHVRETLDFRNFPDNYGVVLTVILIDALVPYNKCIVIVVISKVKDAIQYSQNSVSAA